RRMARRHTQIAMGRPEEIEAFMLAVDKDRRRRESFHHHSAAQLGQGGLARRRRSMTRASGDSRRVAGSDRKAKISRPGAADVPIDALRLGDHLEAVSRVADRLGIAEQEDTALAQRKM